MSKFGSLVLLVFACACVLETSALANLPTVESLGLTGAEVMSPSEVEAGVLEVVGTEIFTVNRVEVNPRQARRSSREMDKAITNAKLRNAAYLLSGHVSRSGRAYLANIEVFDTNTGESVFSAQRRFRRVAKARDTGRALGKLLASHQNKSKADGNASDQLDTAAQNISHRAIRPSSASEVNATEVSIVTDDRRGRGDQRALRFTIAAGSQLLSEYAVQTAGNTTALGYDLSPQPAVRGELRWALRGSRFAIELAGGYTPLRWNVGIDGLDAPLSPRGHLIDASLSGAYELSLVSWEGGSLFVAPRAGAGLTVLSVAEQQPYDMVIGSTRLAPHAGSSLGLRVGDFTLEGKALARVFVLYDEQRSTTGDGGFGYGMAMGGAARYWVTDSVGLMTGVDYEWTRVDFDGTGTRRAFDGDPVLASANVLHGELRAMVGAAIAY